MQKLLRSILFALACLIAAPSQAALYNINFSGTLYAADGGYSVGDAFSGSLTYNTNAQVLFQTPGFSQYQMVLYGLTVSIDGNTYNYGTPTRLYYDSGSPTSSSLQFLAPDMNTNLIFFNLPDASTFSLPSAAAFSAATAYLHILSPDGQSQGTGQAAFTITPFSAVPEPDTALVMLTGLAALAWVSRRRKHAGRQPA